MRGRSSTGALLLALLAWVGCKSSESPGMDAGPTTCGDAVCPADELCVGHQENCGAMLICTPLPDGGLCPGGSSFTPSCPDGGPPGCFAGCPEAQFACEARPAACGATVDCTCAASICAPGTCVGAMNARVACRAP